jgi:hypothetical protein
MTKYFPLAMLLVCGCTNVENLGSAAHPIFGSPRWALTLGNVNDDDAVAIAFTPNGDVIAGGNFKGAVDFGTQTFVTAKHAGWVSNRSASDGSERWTVVVGTEASAQASVTDLGTTADGSVIVMGGFSGDLHLGDVILHGGTLTLGGDCFVAKYDGEGQLLWARQIGPDTVASCRDLAVAEDGRFAMVGTYQGTLHLPGKTSIAGDHDAFLMAFDPDGRIAFCIQTRCSTMEPSSPLAQRLGSPSMLEREDCTVACTSPRTTQRGALWTPLLTSRTVAASSREASRVEPAVRSPSRGWSTNPPTSVLGRCASPAEATR